MKKLRHFQPALITATYFPHFLGNPKLINQGRCWQWAWLARKTFTNVELWDTCEHAFVRYQGKFYDSERLLGEVNWEDLPAARFGADYEVCPECEACGRPAGISPLTEKQFQFHWHSQTDRYRTTFSDLDCLAERKLARHVRNT